MNTRIGKRNSGFTIIELMIVVGLVALLLALAYPSYLDYVRKGKRGEAQQLLMNWAINQEIWRSNNTTYNGITDSSNANYIIPDTEHYGFDFAVAPTATVYTLRASAKTGDDQNNDFNKKTDPATDCSTLTLDQNGTKLPAACWE